MAKPVKKRRSYRSPVREEQARATRAAILEAATQLFEASGYAGTTISAVATAARVAPETVYATFGSKRGLLLAIFQAAATGDGAQRGLLERPWVAEAREEPDQRRRLAIMAAATGDTLARSAPLLAALHQAADSEPGLAALRREIDARQRRDARILVGILAEAGPLRLRPADAADAFVAIGGGDLYRRLTQGCGWGAKKAAGFIEDLIARTILREP